MKNHLSSLPKIIIDTDAGHDDVLAMMLLVKSQRYDVLGITTVAGNSTVANATRNATFTLDLLKRRDIPIFSGRNRPLRRELVTAVVHGKSGLDGIDTSMTEFKLTGDAHLQIESLVRAYPKKVTIITLGPLTNIARMFAKDQKLCSLVKEIIMMGGAIDVCGNKNRVAEFNMFVDPEAADIVFRSKVKKTLVPLDPCNNIILYNSDFENLKESVLYLPIKKMMSQFIKGIKKYEGVNGALVYDAVAAYYLLNPFAFQCKPMDVVVEIKGDYTSGMTVAEKRIAADKIYNVNVVTKVDRNKFINDFTKIIKS